MIDEFEWLAKLTCQGCGETKNQIVSSEPLFHLPQCLSNLDDLSTPFLKAASNYVQALSSVKSLIKDSNGVFFIWVTSVTGTVPVNIRHPVNICWTVRLCLWLEIIICSVHNSLLKNPECGIFHRCYPCFHTLQSKKSMCTNTSCSPKYICFQKLLLV